MSEVINTERLILRRWRIEDAPSMYELAKDPAVGPIAGWPPHKNVEESRSVIENVLNGPEAYAICFKEDESKPIGCIELKMKGCDLAEEDDECELGYWLGKPYWGQGIMPEAARALIRRAFEDLNMNRIWLGYYDGNNKSDRVRQKLGFKHQWTNPDVEVPLLNIHRVGHVNLLTKDDWEKSND